MGILHRGLTKLTHTVWPISPTVAVRMLERLRTCSFHKAGSLCCLKLVLKAWGTPGEGLVFVYMGRLKNLGSDFRMAEAGTETE